MEDTVNERMKRLIFEVTGGRQTMFAEKIGVAQSTINSIVGKRQTKPGYEILNRIRFEYPNINIDWLLTGEGEMFLSNKPADQGQFGSEVERLLRQENEELRKDKSYLRNQVEFLTKLIEDKGLGKDKVMKGIAAATDEVTAFMTPQLQLSN